MGDDTHDLARGAVVRARRCVDWHAEDGDRGGDAAAGAAALDFELLAELARVKGRVVFQWGGDFTAGGKGGGCCCGG